jgi:Rhs element Vgr protein
MTLTRSYAERNFCVQYRESDFAFASRVMEEEGIYYYFEHRADGHTLVLSDLMLGHPRLPKPYDVLPFEESPSAPGAKVLSWEKAQQVAPTRFVVRDRHFEVPRATLEANALMHPHVQVGAVAHTLRLEGLSGMEVYMHPGDFAQHFDGVAPGGAEQAGKLQPIFNQSEATAQLLMEREAAQSLRIEGESDCPCLLPGHVFALSKHPHAQGEYLLTRVQHEVYLPGFRSGVEPANQYHNRFQCLPKDLKYRPPGVTPRPTVHGTQTATVSGPTPGEIHTDKYGRIKIKFPWDRQQEQAAETSLWIRVVQPWAGQGWGAISLPRVGQEVIVDFLDGNPDRPIVLGSVYNSEQMPPYALPEKRMVSGIKSHSLLSTDPEHFNEVRMDDTAGQELLSLTAQKDLRELVKNDATVTVQNDLETSVDHNTTWNFGTSPLTMNYVATWNNIEINKLTKTVVSSVSHADATALKTEVYGMQVTGVAALKAEIDFLKYEKVLTKSYESCGAKSLSTKRNLTENVGRHCLISVGKIYDLTAQDDVHINSAEDSVLVNAANAIRLSAMEDIDLVARNKDLDSGKIRISGYEEVIVQSDDTVKLRGKYIVLEATEQIVLSAPQVVTYGDTDTRDYGDFTEEDLDVL